MSIKNQSLCTELILSWVRLTLCISGVFSIVVPVPISSLYKILTFRMKTTRLSIQNTTFLLPDTEFGHNRAAESPEDPLWSLPL